MNCPTKKETFVKNALIAVGAVSAAVALTFGASPAWAVVTDPFAAQIVQGDVNVDLNDYTARIGHVLGWDGSTTVGRTVSHKQGELWLRDGTDTWNSWCDGSNEIVTTEPTGDVVVDCDMQNPDNLLSALEVTPQFRVFAPNTDGVVLARVLYKVKNPTTATITVSEIGTEMNWFYSDNAWPTLTNYGSDAEGADYTDNTTVRWINSAYYLDASTVDSDFTTFGGAIRAADKPMFNQANGSIGGDYYVDFTSADWSIGAGETKYFAFYGVYAYASTATGSAQAALDNTNAFMATFDGAYEGVLTAGIPDCADVVNWGATKCELPDTGAVDATGYVVGAAAVVCLGVALIVIRRRRSA
jgi:LPXTG-motif cell wall-anchored protein